MPPPYHHFYEYMPPHPLVVMSKYSYHQRCLVHCVPSGSLHPEKLQPHRHTDRQGDIQFSHSECNWYQARGGVRIHATRRWFGRSGTNQTSHCREIGYLRHPPLRFEQCLQGRSYYFAFVDQPQEN
jgi:hypothetical protein